MLLLSSKCTEGSSKHQWPLYVLVHTAYSIYFSLFITLRKHFHFTDRYIHKAEWREHNTVFHTLVPTAPTYLYLLYIWSALAIPHPSNLLWSLAEYRWQVNLEGMETLTSPEQTQTEPRVSGLLLWMISMLALSCLSFSITLEKKYGHQLPTVSTTVIQVFQLPRDTTNLPLMLRYLL